MPDIKPWLTPRFLLALALIYSAFLTLVSILEKTDLPKVPMFPFQDKVAHFVAYAGLAVLWGAYWLRRSTPSFWKPYLLVLLISSFIYGTIIEFLQAQITQSRSADPYDVVANTVGMFIGATAIFYLRSKVGLNNKV
ncbi:VanZ family protein [Gilvibacter sediminis]|uniref:VanZ family protein n=1 Tax=Gilvibacter sediminis TaxID=379071 RepID=UPI003AF31AA2